MNYIIWKRKAVLSNLVGMIVWMSLSTFMIMAKHAIGVGNIPMFEVTIFIMGLLGVKVAHSHIVKMSTSVLLDIVSESVFLIGIYLALIYGDLAIAGIATYMVIIITAVTRTISNENMRVYEDMTLTKMSHKKALGLLRKLYQNISLYGGAIGTTIALICLSYFKVDIVLFTKIMLVGNVLSNMYDWYIWNKYVRVL